MFLHLKTCSTLNGLNVFVNMKISDKSCTQFSRGAYRIITFLRYSLRSKKSNLLVFRYPGLSLLLRAIRFHRLMIFYEQELLFFSRKDFLNWNTMILKTKVLAFRLMPLENQIVEISQTSKQKYLLKGVVLVFIPQPSLGTGRCLHIWGTRT